MKKRNKEEILLLSLWLPSITGILVFFVVPFIVSFYYALIDNPVTANFVGIKNFAHVIGSESFRLALKNTLKFMATCIPLNLIVSLFFSLIIHRAKKIKSILAVIFLLPLAIPSGSVVFFWESIFGLNGLVNKLLFSSNPRDWIQSSYATFIIVIIFLWKNIGFSIVLFSAALNLVPKEYYEAAVVEGAGAYKKFTKITFPYIVPTTFLVFILSIINSFKCFKEIYLLAGNYPNQSIYMLQHYVNNQFASMNYQRLVSAAYVLFVFITAIIVLFFYFQKRFTKDY